MLSTPWVVRGCRVSGHRFRGRIANRDLRRTLCPRRHAGSEPLLNALDIFDIIRLCPEESIHVYHIDLHPELVAELEQRLIQLKALTPEFPIVLRGDNQTQYQNVMDVLDLLGRLNITQVGLATKPLVK